MAITNGSNGEHGNAKEVEYRDPSVYSEYSSKWSTTPEDEAGWIRRAQQVADILAADAVVRDAENKSPRAEVALLKYAGLLKVLGPKKYGGGEQPWSFGYKVIRKVAEADGYVVPPFQETELIGVGRLECSSDTTYCGLLQPMSLVRLSRQIASRSSSLRTTTSSAAL